MTTQSDLVTLGEAARRLGLQNLRQFKRRYADSFPKPREHVGPLDMYDWKEVAEWYFTTITPQPRLRGKRKRPA